MTIDPMILAVEARAERAEAEVARLREELANEYERGRSEDGRPHSVHCSIPHCVGDEP